MREKVKERLVGWIDYDKKEKDFVYPIYIFMKRPATKHTNPDIVSKKVRITIHQLQKRRGK